MLHWLASAMSSNLSAMLKELSILQVKIENELKKSTNSLKSSHRIKIFPTVQDAEIMEKDLPSYDNPYYMLTLTFHPNVAYNLDEYGQTQRLKDSLALLDEYIYYGCLEKHKSGVLHSHALIICDHHEVQSLLHKIKKNITVSVKLDPAINIKPVKKSNIDVNRSFKYIIDHKIDHPIFKQLIFNR